MRTMEDMKDKVLPIFPHCHQMTCICIRVIRPIKFWIIKLLILTSRHPDKAGEDFSSISPNGHLSALGAVGMAAFAFFAHHLFIDERERPWFTEIFLAEGWCYEIHLVVTSLSLCWQLLIIVVGIMATLPWRASSPSRVW